MGDQFLRQLQQSWARLTRKQRLLLGAGALVTLFALAAMVKIFGSPEYKPLMVDLEPAGRAGDLIPACSQENRLPAHAGW